MAKAHLRAIFPQIQRLFDGGVTGGLPDGRFKLEGLVPGAKYRLQVLEGGVRILGGITGEITLEPGEARDLGDVRVRADR